MVNGVIIALVALNLVQLYLSDRKDRRSTTQIDNLTSKIMAPDLNTYTVNAPERQRKQIKAPTRDGEPIHEIVGVSDASEEEIHQALAKQAGRSGEFEA